MRWFDQMHEGIVPVSDERQMVVGSQLCKRFGIRIPLIGQQNRHGARLGDDGHEVRVTVPARHHMLMQMGRDPCARYLAPD